MNDINKKEDENLGSFYMGRSRTPPQPKRYFPQGLLTIVTLLAFAAVIWYAYPRGAEKYADMDVPVVKADTSPVKTEPTDPGGMDVPHQDSTVFDPLEKKASASGEVEKILPGPEEPMDKTIIIKSEEAPVVPVIEAAPQPKMDLAPQIKDNAGMEKLVPKEVEPVKKVEMDPVEAPAKKAPAAKAANVSVGNVYVQLGSYREMDGLKKDWERIKKKYPDQLGNLTLKAQKVDLAAKGIYYRLQAGKLTEAQAREICAVLKESIPGGCILVKN
jgi:hypothetical protein